MALSRKIQEALNGQLNREFYSSYLYLSMASHFEVQGLRGFAHWMELQTEEEHIHAMKFYHYIHERASKVNLTSIGQPREDWGSPLAVFEEAYKHEQSITGHINDLATLAIGEKDHATHIFLQWFISEQVEEENATEDIIQKLKLIGKDTQGLFLLDRELGERQLMVESSR